MCSVLSCLLCHLIIAVSMVIATHVPRMHCVITKIMKVIFRGIRHAYFHVSLALSAMNSGVCNYILVLPTYDCVVKLCNPYIVKSKIKVTLYKAVT